MGFDLYGEKPKNKTGEYFRNNVWWWRPLWQYVSICCADFLTNTDRTKGELNDSYLITKEKSDKIHQRLTELIKEGHTKKWQEQRQKYLDELPLEKCEFCKGTGTRNDEYVKGECNSCQGKGEKKSWETYYPFDQKNVKEFAEFCKQSGGFEIS